MEERIKAGDVVKHFKRELIAEKDNGPNLAYLYEVLSTNALDTATENRVVVYRALYGNHAIFARPYEDFMGMVDRHKYPEVSQVYRFEKV